MEPRSTRSHGPRACRRFGAVAWLALLVSLAWAPPARTEVIDRILAVVGGEIITLSDARAALRFGLLPPDVSADPVGAALQRLIDRRLILAEVERYRPAEPSAEAVEAGVAAVRARFPDAAAFDAALGQTALSREGLRRIVRDNLRIESYIDQRFASAREPPDEDVQRYYRENRAEFATDGQVPPLESIRERVRARLVQTRENAAMREWLDGLRRRGSVVVLYLPEKSGKVEKWKSGRSGKSGEWKSSAYRRTARMRSSGPGWSAEGVKRATSRLCSNSRMYSADSRG